MTPEKLYSTTADQVARICGYKSEEHFYAQKPTLLEKEKFKELCADRDLLKLEAYQKSFYM